MNELDPATREVIHILWDELTDFDVSQTDAAARHLQETLCGLTGAWNATWGCAIRLASGDGSDDPLQGWRVAVTRLLHPLGDVHPDAPFQEIQGHWNQREVDPSFLLPLREIDRFRTYALRRDLPASWFDGAYYQTFFQPYGTVDAAWVGFPLNPDAQSHVGFYSHTTFTERDIALLAYALRGIKWFHRQVMLTNGTLVARAPLTPTERRVLQLLLTKAPEKLIADQLGLAASTTHQHVVSVFRKFAVRSRAELMSLWLRRSY